MNKKNIMIITQALTGGGAERLAADLSKGLKDIFNVYLVVYQRNENEYEYGGERIDLNLYGDTTLKKVLVALKRICLIRKLKRKLYIDCSISFVPHVDYTNIFTRLRSERVIIDVVSNMSLAFPSGYKKLFRKFILNKADYIITVSEGVRRDVVNSFSVSNDKSITIYNTCDIVSIEECCINSTYDKYFQSEKNMYITSMGSFRHPKGQWHLLKAFSIVKKKNPDVVLILLGDGPYRKQLKTLVHNLGIEDSVIMPGFVNNPHFIIKRSHVFAFSSVYEGFGNALIEALACGTAVVSSDCPFGPREILAPDTDFNKVTQEIEKAKYGILVPPFGNNPIDISSEINENEQLFGQAILEMLNDRAMRDKYVEKGLSYSKEFEVDNITKKWISCINKLINDD